MYIKLNFSWNKEPGGDYSGYAIRAQVCLGMSNFVTWSDYCISYKCIEDMDYKFINFDEMCPWPVIQDSKARNGIWTMRSYCII